MKLMDMVSGFVGRRQHSTNAIGVILSAVFTSAVNFLLSIYLARTMGIVNYGLFAFTISLILTGSNSIGLPIGVSLAKLAVDRNSFAHDLPTLKIVGAMAVALSVFYGLCVLIYISIYHGEAYSVDTLARSVQLLLSIAFLTIDNSIKGWLTALGSLRAYATAMCISIVANALGILLVINVYQSNVAEAIFVGATLQLVSTSVIAATEYKSVRFSSSIRPTTQSYSIVWQLITPKIVSAIFFPAAILATNLYLMDQVDGARQVAVFAIAQQWLGLILFVPNQLGKVLFPLFCTKALHSRAALLPLHFATTASHITITTFFAVFAMSLASLFPHIYGSDYVSSIETIEMGFYLSIPIAGAIASGYVLSSLNYNWVATLLNATWLLLYFVSFLSVTKPNSAAALNGLLIAYTIHFVLSTSIAIIAMRLNK